MTDLIHTCARQLSVAAATGSPPITEVRPAPPSDWRADEFTPRAREGRILLSGSIVT